MTKAEKHLQWLRENKSLLKLAEIERRIGLTRGNLQKIVAGEVSKKGYAYRIPDRCLPDLFNLVKELRKL